MLYEKRSAFYTRVTFAYVLYYTIYCLYRFYSKENIFSNEIYEPINILGLQILVYLFLSFFAAMNPVKSFLSVKKGISNRKKKKKKYFDIGNINIIQLDNKLTPYIIFTLINIIFIFILYLILYLPLSYFGVIQHLYTIFSGFETSQPYWGIVIFLLMNIVYILLYPNTSYENYYTQFGICLWSLSYGLGFSGFFVLFNVTVYFNYEETQSEQFFYKALYIVVMWFNILYFFLNYMKKRIKHEKT